MVSQKHIRKDFPCLRFSAICSNVYEIRFEIKEVLIMNSYIYLQYLGGEDPPPFHRDALMRMGTHDKPKRYKRRSSMLEAFHVVDRMLMKTHLFVVMYTKEIERVRRF